MTKYILIIEEPGYFNEIDIIADSEEVALYNAIDMLQLDKGIDWIRAAIKRLKETFDLLEKQLKSGDITLGYGIHLKKARNNNAFYKS